MRVLCHLAVALMIAASVVSLHPASAQIIDANRLLELCAARDPVCTGYAMGIADGRNADPHGISFCVPAGTPPNQLHDVVLAFLRKVPDRRFPAPLLVAGAFAEAYRCAGQN